MLQSDMMRSTKKNNCPMLMHKSLPILPFNFCFLGGGMGKIVTFDKVPPTTPRLNSLIC